MGPLWCYASRHIRRSSRLDSTILVCVLRVCVDYYVWCGDDGDKEALWPVIIGWRSSSVVRSCCVASRCGCCMIVKHRYAHDLLGSHRCTANVCCTTAGCNCNDCSSSRFSIAPDPRLWLFRYANYTHTHTHTVLCTCRFFGVIFDFSLRVVLVTSIWLVCLSDEWWRILDLFFLHNRARSCLLAVSHTLSLYLSLTLAQMNW